ncbi:MAG: hypothetical protein WCF33_01580 [Pseudonocardiaceae bacterium]
MTQSSDVDGPHRLPKSDQERCVVKGVRIDASGQCDAIRDGKPRGVVLYLRGVTGPGVLIDDDAVRALAGGSATKTTKTTKTVASTATRNRRNATPTGIGRSTRTFCASPSRASGSSEAWTSGMPTSSSRAVI